MKQLMSCLRLLRDTMTETEAQLGSPTSQLADCTLLAASHWLQAKERASSSRYAFVIVQCYLHFG